MQSSRPLKSLLLSLNTSFINQFNYTSSVATIRNFNEIPGPKPYPIIGNLLELKNFGNINFDWVINWIQFILKKNKGGEFDIFDYRKFQIDLQKKYGDIV